jgi:hypothetical protein
MECLDHSLQETIKKTHQINLFSESFLKTKLKSL